MTHTNPGKVVALAALVVLTLVSLVYGLPRLLQRQHVTEAINELGQLARGAAVYYVKPRGEADGARMVCQFPQGEIRSTIARSCCDPSVALPGTNLCDPERVLWNRPLWNALHFRIDEPQAYVYSYKASGTLADAQFVVEAYGDLDCDGVISTFRFVGHGDPKARADDCVLTTQPIFESVDPDE